MQLSVVIPCYNEEKIIYQSYQRLMEVLGKDDDCKYDYELIFANDGSTDKTLNELNRIKADNQRVRIVSYLPNHGAGYASRQLYDAAQGDVIIQMDADLAMDPQDTIPTFLKEIQNADVVIGSRYAGLKADYPLRRRIPSRIYHTLNKILFKIDIRDTQSGFFAFKKEPLKSVKCNSDGFEIHVELFHKLKKQGYNFKEVPIKFRHKTESGETSILVNGPKMLYNTLRIWRKIR